MLEITHLKESVALLAQAGRTLANVRAGVELAKLKGVVTSTHLEQLAKANAERDFALECFLVSWGVWVEGAGFCPTCGRPGAGFCGDCQASAARLPAGDVA